MLLHWCIFVVALFLYSSLHILSVRSLFFSSVFLSVFHSIFLFIISVFLHRKFVYFLFSLYSHSLFLFPSLLLPLLSLFHSVYWLFPFRFLAGGNALAWFWQYAVRIWVRTLSALYFSDFVDYANGIIFSNSTIAMGVSRVFVLPRSVHWLWIPKACIN
jgi:hypothetical protein